MSATLRLRKAEKAEGRRYYVEVDGQKVGWVLNWGDGEGWAAYAPVYDSLKANRLSHGNATRRDAVMELLSELKIRHGGRIIQLSHETWKDEAVYLDCDHLDELWNRLLDEKYPGVA